MNTSTRLARRKRLYRLLTNAVILGMIGLLDFSRAGHAGSMVIAWGDDTYGQTEVPAGLTNVVAIAAGQNHSLALGADGTVAAWGCDCNGQTDVPTGLANTVSIAAGGNHSLALAADGRVTAWGDNAAGMLYVPTGLINVVAIAAGFEHSLALKADGTVAAWGLDVYGSTHVPAGLQNVVAISAGSYHSLALKADGTVVAWGEGGTNGGATSYGQSIVPSDLTNVMATAGGTTHSLALKSDGTPVGWGVFVHGQLTVPAAAPSGLGHLTAISAGQYAAAITSVGRVLGWDGQFVGWAPAPITNAVAIASGYAHSLALKGAGPPFITGPLVDRTVLNGGTAVISATAVGATPLYYQWRFNGTNLPGATNTVLLISGIQLDQRGLYSVVVSNGFGTAVSRQMALRVTFIAAQPQSQTVTESASATFSVVTVGIDPFAFQWQREGIDLVGATNSSYTLVHVRKSDAGVYRVIVSNAVGSETSSNAVLTVVPGYTFTTLAGLAGTPGSTDGMGRAARFTEPCGVAVDPAGNLYVTEYANHTVRKVTADGKVATLAGLAGTAGTNNGPGTVARFRDPEGIARDRSGNLYVADNFNHTIRKMTPDATGTNWWVSTLAGRPGVRGLADGRGSAALFQQPSGLAMDAMTNLYVADWGNGAIRKVTPEGVVATVAPFYGGPDGIAVDATGTFYVDREFASDCAFPSDYAGVYRVTPDGNRTLWASLGCASSSGNKPYGGALDRSGNFYFAGLDNDTVRMITPDGSVHILAGVSGSPGAADGAGNTARFYSYRSGIAIDSTGNLYVADNLNHTIRKGVPFVVQTLPQSQAVLAGTSVTLSVNAVGDGPYFYQWIFAGSALASQTNTALQLGPVWRANSGVYSVIVSNLLGNSITFNATVRALVPPVIQPPEVKANGAVRLLFRDSDGGLPFDVGPVVVQWRTNLPSGADTNWQTVASRCYLTNGFVGVDDTNAMGQSTRFYRILEQ